MDKWYAFVAGFVALAGYAAFVGALIALYDERTRVRRLRDALEHARAQLESEHDALETERDMRVTLYEECARLQRTHDGAATEQQAAEQSIAALQSRLQRAQAMTFLCSGLEKYEQLLQGISPITDALTRANEYGLRMLRTAEECVRSDASTAPQVPPDTEVPEPQRVETTECP
jgi:hypothetical protein